MRHTCVVLASLVAGGVLIAGGCGKSEPVAPSGPPAGVPDIAPASTTDAGGSTESVGSANSSETAGDAWGTLKGRFVVNGTPPKMGKLNINKDVEVCSAHSPVDESVVVGSGGGLANVVVYLYAKKLDAIHPDYDAAATEPVTLDNNACVFVPHVALLRTGQPLILKNSDSVGHNSNITAIKNGSKNVLIPAGGETSVEFDRAESLPIGVMCNIHPWMKGYLLIQDHPYMAVTDSDGNFQMENVPAGEHNFAIWHERLGYLRDFKIGDSQTDKKGRVTLNIGVDETNDLGEVQIDAAMLAEKG